MEGAENVDLAMSFIQSEMGEEVHDSEEKSQETLREQDRFLPIANVARIMKKEIPKTGKIAKDARECVQECVSEFISFITSEASDRCHQEKRKTINGEDILWAMNALGFENYVEPLKLYLQKYREANKGEKEGGIEGSFEADYSTITSFGTEHVNQSDIIPGYGGPSQQLSTPFSL
ncbi:UNVERIFIED_CONTAM: hypothetical protein RMT77_002111 [Armadillidium vulgare]|nr:Nuclear transcription factor Y subunit beta [Armadillidium vulgare]